MRFIGVVEEVAGAIVEAAGGEEEEGSVGTLQAKLPNAEEEDEGLENDELLGI